MSVTDSIATRQLRQDRLTRVGPGTPMGAYLRRFWQPIAVVAELERHPTKKVRLLGEDLALFKTDGGAYGLVADRCPHRGASLSCGMIAGETIQCAYHGWTYDRSGKCLDTPAEPPQSTLKNRISIAGYPVEPMAGLLWTYLGPQPAPLLPRYEHMVRDGWTHDIGISHMPCNWLQIAENTLDPMHVEYLHMKYTNWARKRKGLSEVDVRHHARVGFDLFEYGIIKRRLWEGETEECDEWKIGHPQLFPGTAVVPYHDRWVQYQIRVPVDDTNTLHFWLNCRQLNADEPRHAAVWDNPYQTPDGEWMPDVLNAQDMMVWVTQGPITDHTLEHLGESDRGVALYRRTLLEEIAKVEAGQDPLGVVRDPAKNTPWIELPVEKHFGYTLQGVASSPNYATPDREVVIQ